jgi:hypothetical protein
MPADFDISPIITPPTPAPQPTIPPAQPITPPAPVSPIPPMSKPKSHRLLKWLVLTAAVLFVVTVASLWWGGNSFSANGVVLTMEAPDRATSGDEVTYTVKYENQTKVALTDMSFRLFYPEDSIVLKDGVPTEPDSEGFAVDRLDPGQSGQHEFKVYMVGDKGTIRTARVHLIFKAGTLRSAFEKDASISTTITALPVTLTLVAPPTSVSGQPIQYILDVRNDTTADLSDLKAVFIYPDGFTVQKMLPSPDEGNTTWHLDQLKAGQGTRITVNGVLTGNERETKTVTVSLQRNINGQYVDYVRTDAFTMLSSPLLSVTLTPNNNRDYISFAGDTLRYVVTYANNSRFSLNGLLLGVKLEGDMYDFSRLQVDRGFFDDATKTVVYDSSGVPEFGNLRPGQTGSVTFTVPIKPGLSGSGLGGAKTLFVKATARLATSNVPSGVDGGEVFALDSVITKISSQPTLNQSLLYDNGAGSGPLPPQVGQDTTLTVQWQLTNPGNDVRNTVVTATLPPGVTFKGAATASLGAVPTYDAANKRITWNIGTLPFGTGNGTARAQATFQVSIRPASNQIGQSVTVVSGATLTGTDSFTGQAIQVRLRDWTTDDIEGHTGQGRVVQ